MKKFLIIFASILCVISIGFDIWAIYIHFYSPNKEVSNTYELGILSTTNGENKEPFIEINYFSNENNNGLELFEIKYNFFLDEDRDSLISVGSQYVSNDVDSSLTWGFDRYYYTYEEKHFGFLNIGLEYDYTSYFNTFLTGNNEYFEYQSVDNYENTLGNSINYISDNTRFKVTIGDEIYELGFKFSNTDTDFYLGTVESKSLFTIDLDNRYKYVDQHLFAHDLYESVKSSSFGIGLFDIAKLSNYFDYYKFDNGSYVQLSGVNHDKVKRDFENYFMIKINKSEDGARLSSDSMFNVIKGSKSFNLTDNYSSSEYFIGRVLFDVKQEFLKLVATDEDNKFKIGLKDSFKEIYFDYKDNIVLNVQVDDSTLSEFGAEIIGIDETSFNGFNYQFNLEVN